MTAISFRIFGHIGIYFIGLFGPVSHYGYLSETPPPPIEVHFRLEWNEEEWTESAPDEGVVFLVDEKHRMAIAVLAFMETPIEAELWYGGHEAFGFRGTRVSNPLMNE